MNISCRRFSLTLLLLLISISAFSITAYFSDCQSFHSKHREVISQIVKFKPETVFIGGDITQNGSRREDFDLFFEVMKPLTDIAEIYPAMGNHDKDTDLFLQYFPTVDSLTYYVVEKEDIIWIVLNSNLKLAPGSLQYNWLVNQLEANKERTVVVIMHHPVFSSGAHGDEKGFSFLFPALFKKYSVAAVLSGHDHIYERSAKDGIHYVVFGGGGGSLYNNESKNDYSILFLKTHGFLIFEPENDVMSVTAYDDKGLEIDNFSFPIKSAATTDKTGQSR